MSFREKSAWIFLVSILFVGGFFFLHVPWTLAPTHSADMVHGLLYCVIALVAIEVVAHLVVAFLAPEDAKAPKDEREHLIELKAYRAAYFVYVFGSMMAVWLIHLGANEFALSYAILFALVVAQLVNYAVRIVLHRRGI